MKYSDAGAIPPCEFSAHCLRLLDDLDAPGDESAHRRRLMADARDIQDEYLIEQLRVHVPGCPVCSAKVAEARLQRSQQRQALRYYLVEAESRVPSMAERILSLARQTSQEETEEPSPAQKRQRYMLPEVFISLILPGSNDAGDGNSHFDAVTDQQSPPTTHTANTWLRNGFALATAAALIFAALGVFNHFVFHNGTTPLREEVKSWTSIMIGVSLASSIPIFSKYYNVDTTSGASEQVTPTGLPTQDMQYEALSPDGKDVLFRALAQNQVIYIIWPFGTSQSITIHAADTEASNAIWMDNNRILVSLAHNGVIEFDAHTGLMVRQFAALDKAHLLFYHTPYLYFENAQQTAIYRSNLAMDGQEQLVATIGGLSLSHCVLHPDGVVMYCEAQGKQLSGAGSILYLVNGDGLGVQALSRKGILLGFAPDHTLLFLQAMLNHYRVVKLGDTLQQDRVVMNNAAPVSATIGTGDALLAPDGHGLVVQVNDTSASSRDVWYDDLATQTSREVFSYLPGSFSQIITWDQARVSASPLPVATAA